MKHIEGTAKARAIGSLNRPSDPVVGASTALLTLTSGAVFGLLPALFGARAAHATAADGSNLQTQRDHDQGNAAAADNADKIRSGHETPARADVEAPEDHKGGAAPSPESSHSHAAEAAQEIAPGFAQAPAAYAGHQHVPPGSGGLDASVASLHANQGASSGPAPEPPAISMTSPHGFDEVASLSEAPAQSANDQLGLTINVAATAARDVGHTFEHAEQALATIGSSWNNAVSALQHEVEGTLHSAGGTALALVHGLPHDVGGGVDSGLSILHVPTLAAGIGAAETAATSAVSHTLQHAAEGVGAIGGAVSSAFDLHVPIAATGAAPSAAKAIASDADGDTIHTVHSAAAMVGGTLNAIAGGVAGEATEPHTPIVVGSSAAEPSSVARLVVGDVSHAAQTATHAFAHPLAAAPSLASDVHAPTSPVGGSSIGSAIPAAGADGHTASFVGHLLSSATDGAPHPVPIIGQSYADEIGAHEQSFSLHALHGL